MVTTPSIIQMPNGVWRLEGEQLWDTEVLNVALEHIKEGDTVIDAGAWIGGHAMAYLEKVGHMGFVYAFEPNPLALQCLKLNVVKFNNVLCFNSALGDKVEAVCFSGKKGWYDSAYLGEDQKLFMVGMDSLDKHQLSPNFIKIDVEGCELKTLKCASKTIEKYRPKMVIEINKPALERQGNTPFEVWSWLEDRSYRIKIVEHNADNLTDIYNILCIPR